MRWLVAFVFLFSTLGAPPIVEGHGPADAPEEPSITAVDDGVPGVPLPPPAEEPSPEDEVAPASPISFGAPNTARLPRGDGATDPAGTDMSVPRPPPTR